MTSSARRQQDDLKRILGVEDKGRMFEPWQERAPIPATRGIWQAGDGSTKTGAGPGTDDDGNPIQPVKPDDSILNDNPDGSGGGGGGGTGSDNGAEFIVPDEVPPNYAGNDDLFGGDWGAGGISTYKDCDDDTCIKLNKTGAFVPPEGWLTPDEAPLDEYFELGFFWVYSSNIGLTPTAAVKKIFPFFVAGNRVDYVSSTVTGFSGSIAEVTVKALRQVGGGTLPSVEQTFVYNVTKVSCVGQPTNAYCIPSSPEYRQDFEENVQPQHWPDDGCIQLANVDGQWQSHPKESPNDITTKYSDSKSILDLCTPSGDGVQILPGIDGGIVEWNYTKGIFMTTSPDGFRSFGGATEVTAAVAGAVAGGGYIKQVGAPKG